MNLQTDTRQYTLTDCARLMLIQDAQIAQVLTDIIGATASTLFIIQYQLRAPLRPRAGMRDLLAAILAAADRGCAIRILLNHPRAPRSSDNSHGAIYETLKHTNITIRHHRSDQILHTKMLIADDRLVVMGSHNLSESSLHGSRNTSILLDCPTFALRCTRIYDSLWYDHVPHA